MKIVFIGMIKNESKIIRRCLENLLGFVDAVCITDTGSTDNTIDICNTFLKTSGKPYKVFSSKTGFVDFGTNRTESFNVAQAFVRDELNWDLETTFGLLLDADMNLVVEPNFDKEILKDFDEVKIKQCLANCMFEYYNTRLVKFSMPWVCRGVTHEYWDIDTTFSIKKKLSRQCVLQSKLWINDISDGGCKSDKFERDIRLLLKGLEDETLHPSMKSRYYFYLAQSYMSLDDFEKSIEYYKKRIECGGWNEEVWCSTFYVANALAMSGKSTIDEVEEWCQKAIDLKPERAEPYYLIASNMFQRKMYERAFHYVQKSVDLPVPSHDLMNLDRAVYVYSLKILRILLLAQLQPQDTETIFKHVFEVLDIDCPKEFPELLGYLTTLIEPLEKKETLPIPLSLYEIMNLGVFTENGTTTEVLINNSLLSPSGKRLISLPNDIRIGFYDNKLHMINSQNKVFRLQSNISSSSSTTTEVVAELSNEKDILKFYLEGETVEELKAGHTVKVSQLGTLRNFEKYLSKEVIVETEKSEKVFCKLLSVSEESCDKVLLELIVVKIGLKAMFVDGNNNLKLLLNPSVFGKRFKDFISFTPAVVHKNKLYFVIMTIINNISVHCFLKTDFELKLEHFSKPFCLEAKGAEQIISFTIKDDSSTSVLYSNAENEIKLCDLKETIDDLLILS